MRLYLFIIAIIGAALSASRERAGAIRRRSPVRFRPPPSPSWKAFSSARRRRIRPSRSPSFPTTRAATASRPIALEPGRYTISIRAIGYMLDGPKSRRRPGRRQRHRRSQAQPRSRTSHPTLERRMAQQPAGRPTSRRQFLTMCVGCHTLQRVLTSHAQPASSSRCSCRMARYSPGSTPTQPQPLLPGPRGERPRVDPRRRQGRGGISRERQPRQCRRRPNTQFKPLPRPKGRATRVIITEYDLPRKEAHAARRDRRCRRQGLVFRLRPRSSSACSIPRPAR